MRTEEVRIGAANNKVKEAVFRLRDAYRDLALVHIALEDDASAGRCIEQSEKVMAILRGKL